MQVELTVKKHGAQHQFLKSDATYFALISGYGLGKTLILCWKALILASQNPGCKGLIVSHTYEQLTQNVMPKFIAVLDKCGITYTIKASEHTIQHPWGLMIFRSADRPIVGHDCAFALVDEADLCSDDCFKDILARVRDKNAKKMQICFVGTPDKGKGGWIYTNFVKTPLPGSQLIRGATKENAKNLAPGYIEALTAAYPPKLRAAYLEGEFVDFSADAAYPSFNQEKHVKETFLIKMSSYGGSIDIMRDNYNLELNVGLAFGVRVGAWIVFQRHRVGDTHYVAVIDEIYQEQTNTFQMAEEFIKRYKGKWKNITIYGDAAGKGGQSAAFQSDYDLVRKLLADDFNINVIVPRKNPLVINRINNMELALVGNSEFEMRIHPRCKHLIEDFINVKYLSDGTRRLDKAANNGMTTHCTDALGYALMLVDTPLRKFDRL